MNSEDNKRRLVTKIEDLKNDIISEIAGIIEQNSENKNDEIRRNLNEIKNKFDEIMKSEGINTNQEYLNTQLHVLQNEIKKTTDIPNQDLYSMISTRLNRYVAALLEGKDEEELETQTRRQKGNLEYEIGENKEKRKKDVSWVVIPSIEDYIEDIFSNTMRRLDSFDIRMSNQKFDELKFIILSQLKNKSVNNMEELFIDEDSEMIRIVNAKLEEFFSTVEQMRVKNEKEETDNKKPWELSEEEMKNIDPEKAQRTVENRIIKELPDNVIE